MAEFDRIITGGTVVIEGESDPQHVDIAIRDGRIVRVEAGLDPESADEVVDATGLIVFPGAVDAHQHWGIYSPLADDTRSESAACAQGGVTTALTYMRTGQYYLNKSGPYANFMPEVLAASDGNAFVDYGFHIAPMMREHLGEIGDLIDDFGVSSFKIFMFYGSHGLHGKSADQSSFLMIPEDERYDMAHFEFVMRAIQQARRERPELADAISLSLHCEAPEIMRAYTEMVEKEGELTGLAAYSASRPQHSEGLAVTIASYLAYETDLPTINLLHLSSAKAMDAAMKMAGTFPDIDFAREVTIGHLTLDVDSPNGGAAKVNPPIRPREDVEALWAHVLAGDVTWISSDHACCRDEMKFGEDHDDIWMSKSGFGGAEYLLPALVTEAKRRGLPLGSVAQLISTNPARRFGLSTKGAIAVGRDADLAFVDPDSTWTIRAADSESAQEYTPFEGMELTARVARTILRGQDVFDGSEVVGEARGAYLRRPV